MIQLHTMVPGFGLPTFTPFGLKLIAHLRLLGLPFAIVEELNPARGPKGKFPWIVDGDSVIGDSELIVQHLHEARGAELDAALDAGQRARSHALRRMTEEGLCFGILYFRWVDQATYEAATRVALGPMPAAVRTLLRPIVRRRILRDLRGQGTGRLRADEVVRLCTRDIDTLAMHLADQPYLCGGAATSVDASVAAFLAVLWYPPFDNPLKERLAQHANLTAYVERMRALCWSA